MTPTGLATASSTSGYVLDDHSWPRQWHGEWIGPKPVTSTEERMGREARPADFTRHLYRDALELESVPEKAPLRITADSRYVLYVNGQEVGRGPVRSQPRKLHYDSYDVAALLRRQGGGVHLLNAQLSKRVQQEARMAPVTGVVV